MTQQNRNPANPYLPGDNAEWYTPKHIIAFAYAVLGHIGLDPASSRSANVNVGADRYFTKRDDGLAQAWTATTVWCNPPYGRGNKTGVWYDKMRREHDAGHFVDGLFLANNKTETRWFQDALGRYPVLLLAGRLSFLPNSPVSSRNGFFGSVIIYFPAGSSAELPLTPLYKPPYAEAVRRFCDLSAPLGRVVTAIN